VTTGATRVAGVIGHPVRHSLSPALHNAAYRALGLDWTYVAFDVADGAAPAALDAMRVLGIAGLSVTMPHKAAVADACDECSEHASTLRSVNTVTRLDDGRLRGDSTDGEGFLRALADAKVEVDDADVLVLGAGPAARAVVLALGEAGARVKVCARRAQPAQAVARLVNAEVVAWHDRALIVAGTPIIVNATSVGMAPDEDSPVAPESLRAGQVVADLVYHPLETPLLRAARAAGAHTVDGLGMLAHQAALQVVAWTGADPPVEVMRAAATAELAGRS
jgi:shikimate dehydrogenase